MKRAFLEDVASVVTMEEVPPRIGLELGPNRHKTCFVTFLDNGKTTDPKGGDDRGE